MPGKVIAVANMKGGVGKTATVVATAEAFAASGKTVLVIDFDPQTNASIVLAGDAPLAKLIEGGMTIDAFLEDYILDGRRKKFDDCIAAHVSDVTHGGNDLNISLLASSPALRTLELKFLYKVTKLEFDLEHIVSYFWNLMRTQLHQSSRQYDYVLLDCAPGISTLTEASIRLADLVIVPTIADTLSTYGLQAFCNSIFNGTLARESSFRAAKSHPHVLITRHDKRLLEHRNTAERIAFESLRNDPPFSLFKTRIPERTAIATALGKTGEGSSFTNKWGEEVIEVLSALTKEIEEKLHGHRA